MRLEKTDARTGDGAFGCGPGRRPHAVRPRGGGSHMPRVKMTPMTRFALYFLRFYLVLLLVLLFVRFLRGLH